MGDYVKSNKITDATMSASPCLPDTDLVCLYVRDNGYEKGMHVWIDAEAARDLAAQLLTAAGGWGV